MDNVNGSANADFIWGSSAANTLDGAAGNDWLKGDGGIPSPGSHGDVADYTDGSDKLNLNGTGASFGTLTLSNNADGAHVDYGGNTLLILTGVNTSVLNSTDFILV